MDGKRTRREAGFSLIEVVVAIVILAIGILGLAGTTALSVRQVRASDMATTRAAALQSTLERLRAMEYDSIAAGVDTVGQYTNTWTSSDDSRSKLITVVSEGPGMQSVSGGMPVFALSVQDTFSYRIIRP